MHMTLKCMKWFLVLVSTVMGIGATRSETDNHNGDEHNKLCAVLKAAVALYNEAKRSGSPLKEALEKTIFGNNGVKEDPSSFPIPDDYTKKGPNTTENNRKQWCGGCNKNNQRHNPGESATHDLVCLCAPGQNGHPISGVSGKKLCGQSKDSWVPTGGVFKGWYTKLYGEIDQEREHLNETWEKVVKGCFKGGYGNDLENALTNFKGNLKGQSNKYLGEQSKESECDGTSVEGVCVKYHTECAENSWWKKLEEAIRKHNAWEKAHKNIKTEKDRQLNDSKGPQEASEKQAQTPKTTSRVDRTLQTEEAHNSTIEEKLIANITATKAEDGMPINKQQWLLLVASII